MDAAKGKSEHVDSGAEPPPTPDAGAKVGRQDDVVRPTLIERLNMLLPLPYVVSCLLVSALIGPLGFFLVSYLSTFDIGKAVHVILYSTSGRYTTLQLLGNDVFYPGIAFYCAMMIRFMRRRIVSAEPELVRLSPEWRATVERSFGRISNSLPPLLMAGVITLLLSPLLLSQIEGNVGLNQDYFAVSYPIFFFGVATFIWTYASSLWGLHRAGKHPLRLPSYRTNPFLGLRGFGSISFSLTFVFFGGVLLGTLLISSFAADLPLANFVLFIVALTVIGLVMLFLPLQSIHGRMEEEKEHLRTSLLGELVRRAKEDEVALQGDRAGVAKKLERTIILEHDYEEVEKLPTWPFDSPIAGRMVAILVTVVVSIVSHLVLVSLNL